MLSGKDLKILRKRAGLTQTDLARVIEVSVTSIIDTEKDKYKNSFTKQKIIDYLNNREKLSKLLNFETIEFKTLEELKRWILKSPYKIDSWEDWTYLYKGKSSIEGEAMFNDLKVKIRKR